MRRHGPDPRGRSNKLTHSVTKVPISLACSTRKEHDVRFRQCFVESKLKLVDSISCDAHS